MLILLLFNSPNHFDDCFYLPLRLGNDSVSLFLRFVFNLPFNPFLRLKRHDFHVFFFFFSFLLPVSFFVFFLSRSPLRSCSQFSSRKTVTVQNYQQLPTGFDIFFLVRYFVLKACTRELKFFRVADKNNWHIWDTSQHEQKSRSQSVCVWVFDSNEVASFL